MAQSKFYEPQLQNPLVSIPSRISKYELLELLGGGMSRVFRARDTVLGRELAIKILTAEGATDPDSKARFLLEARIASNFAHDNILEVYDFGEENGQPYMVMEFLQGRTLRTAIKDRLLPDCASKLRIGLQVARALAFLHQQKDPTQPFSSVTHRDVKPENVNIDDHRHAKLMDFGIAKTPNVALTQTGFVLGTPYYMAPEQITGQPVTPSIDVYAFGVMLYEMLLGTRPYASDTIENIFYRKITDESIALLPLRDAGVPLTVCAIVRGCTLKNLDERWDIKKLIAELEKALVQPDVQPAPAKAHPPAPQPVRRSAPVAAPIPAPRSWTARIALMAVLALSLPAGPVARGRVTPPVPPPQVTAPAPVEPVIPAKPDPPVETASVLAASLSQIISAYEIGSTVVPKSKAVEITASAQPVEFVVKSNGRWLRADLEQGVTPATVNIAMNPAGLEVGWNCGRIDINSVNPDQHLAIAACVQVTGRLFTPPPVAVPAVPPAPAPAPVPPTPDLPVPPAITGTPLSSGPGLEVAALAPVPPVPAAAEHLVSLGRRNKGILSFSNDSISFVEANGHRFEGPLHSVSVECGGECFITLLQSSSGHRDRLAVPRAVANQLEDFLQRSKISGRPALTSKSPTGLGPLSILKKVIR